MRCRANRKELPVMTMTIHFGQVILYRCHLVQHSSYISYYHEDRCHSGLGTDTAYERFVARGNRRRSSLYLAADRCVPIVTPFFRSNAREPLISHSSIRLSAAPVPTHSVFTRSMEPANNVSVLCSLAPLTRAYCATSRCTSDESACARCR